MPLVFSSSENSDVEAALIERLKTHNRESSAGWAENRGNKPEAEPLSIYVMDEAGHLRVGLVGRTNAIRCWLEVTTIWVDDNYRGQNLGRELMARAESEARARGYIYSRLATTNYQAPGFYEKCGYVLYGQLENCPPGDTVFYFRKDS